MKSFNELLKEGVSLEVVAKYPDSVLNQVDNAIRQTGEIIDSLDEFDTTKLSKINKNFKEGMRDLKSAQKFLTMARRDLKKYVK